MNDQTFNRRYEQLVTLIKNHPHRKELLQMMQEQVIDDAKTVAI
jgi:uncharacterized protein YecT (DUF1311 family)